MAKRKVIKFVHEGKRKLKHGDFYTDAEDVCKWECYVGSKSDFDVYHRIETEEEVPRWRAQVGEVYYRANVFLQIVSNVESRCLLDDIAFDSGNYFQTEEQAQKYLDHCKTFFENN